MLAQHIKPGDWIQLPGSNVVDVVLGVSRTQVRVQLRTSDEPDSGYNVSLPADQEVRVRRSPGEPAAPTLRPSDAQALNDALNTTVTGKRPDLLFRAYTELALAHARVDKYAARVEDALTDVRRDLAKPWKKGEAYANGHVLTNIGHAPDAHIAQAVVALNTALTAITHQRETITLLEGLE